MESVKIKPTTNWIYVKGLNKHMEIVYGIFKVMPAR